MRQSLALASIAEAFPRERLRFWFLAFGFWLLVFKRAARCQPPALVLTRP
jgi:hypothetical protein